MNKLVLCDIPNTLYDSRQRTTENFLFTIDMKEDELNYPVYALLKSLDNSGYQIMLIHYILNRLDYKVSQLTNQISKNLSYKIITNANTQNVYNNRTLKKYYYEMFEDSIDFVIDNDDEMKEYWLEKNASLIQVPMKIKYKDN